VLDRVALLGLVVRPALASLHLVPPAGREEVEFRRAEEQLLMGTQAQESPEGHRHQDGGGPALGIWQMEGATHDDVWRNYLGFRSILARRVAAPVLVPPWPPSERLIYDDLYAARMARIQYYRAPEALPRADDLAGMEALYLRRYNAGGAAKPGEWTAAYLKHVAPLFG